MTRIILALLALSALCNAPASAQRVNVASTNADQPILGNPQILVLAAQRPLPEVDKIVAEMDSTLLRPGPVEPNWDKAGIDPLVLFAASPGGLDGNLLHGDPETPTIRYYGKAKVALPPNLTEAIVYAGDKPPEFTEPDLTVARMANNLWIRMEIAVWQKGNARCGQANVRASLLADPTKHFDERDMIAGVMAAKVLLKMRDFRPCVVIFAAGNGYRERTFLPDGRTLPDLDKENGVFGLAPLTHAAQLLAEMPKLNTAPPES